MLELGPKAGILDYSWNNLAPAELFGATYSAAKSTR